MKLFVLNDRVVKEIVNRLTIEDNVREIIENIILRFDYSFTNFVYSMFSVYTTYYTNLLDENSHINYHEAQRIFSDLSKSNLIVEHSNVFVADIYDIMYVSCTWDKTRFKHYFYEDMYNRLENLLGVQNATTYMEEVFDAMDNIFSAIEENLVFNIIESDDPQNNIIFYLEMTPHGLMIYVPLNSDCLSIVLLRTLLQIHLVLGSILLKSISIMN